MTIDSSLQTYLNYDRDQSARKTGKVLAVVDSKINGRRVKELKEINLKKANFFTQIALWWKNSYQLNHVAAFILSHQSLWHAQLESNTELQAQLEKQSVPLCRKMNAYNFWHRRDTDSKKIMFPKYEWKLNVSLFYPKSDEANSAMIRHQVTIGFDRLTTNQEIWNRLYREQNYILGHVNGKEVTPTVGLMAAFQKYVYEGGYQGASDSAPFLRDDEKGEDRTCAIHASGLDRPYFVRCHYASKRPQQ